MFNIILKSFITCCLVVGLLPSFSCLCTTKAFAQANESIFEIIFGESSGSEGFYAENDNDQLLGADDCLPNDNNQPQSTNVGNQSHDVVQNELTQQSYALDSMPVNASDENGTSSNENPDLKPQNSKENTTPVESNNSVENSENDFKYVDYEITITTQDIRYAGFDGLVQVKVNGEYGSTGFHTLDKSGYNDFERGDCDLYMFKDRFVGAVISLTIETDSEDNWFMEGARLIVENQKYYFWANFNWVNKHLDIPVSQEREYNLEYRTPNYADAGSDDDFYVCFVGDKGYTGYYNLGDPSKGETKKTSFFSKDVGKIKYAIVGGGQNVSLNNTALDMTVSASIDISVQLVMAFLMCAVTKLIKNKKLKTVNPNERIKEYVKEEISRKNNNAVRNNNNNINGGQQGQGARNAGGMIENSGNDINNIDNDFNNINNEINKNDINKPLSNDSSFNGGSGNINDEIPKEFVPDNEDIGDVLDFHSNAEFALAALQDEANQLSDKIDKLNPVIEGCKKKISKYEESIKRLTNEMNAPGCSKERINNIQDTIHQYENNISCWKNKLEKHNNELIKLQQRQAVLKKSLVNGVFKQKDLHEVADRAALIFNKGVKEQVEQVNNKIEIDDYLIYVDNYYKKNIYNVGKDWHKIDDFSFGFDPTFQNLEDELSQHKEIFNQPWNPFSPKDTGMYLTESELTHHEWIRRGVIDEEEEAGSILNLNPSQIKEQNRIGAWNFENNFNFLTRPKAMSNYVYQKFNTKLRRIHNLAPLKLDELTMLQSRKFHYIATYVWFSNPDYNVYQVVEVAKILYECVESLKLFDAGFYAGLFVDLGSLIYDFENYVLNKDVLLKDIIDKDTNNSEEARFLKGIYVLNRGLKYENSSQKLSDKYLNFLKDFNSMFRDFCSNTENAKQISTQTLTYLIELLSSLNTFESEYSANGFKSYDLADISNMLFYVYYCRAGLDNFYNLGLIENTIDNDNESNPSTNNSLDENNYLRITKQPSKLSYEMLEPLNIEDVVLTLKIAGSEPVELSYYDLDKYGITVNHYSGWALSLEDKTLDFSFVKDNINLSASIPITVELPKEMKDIVYEQGKAASIDSVLQLLQSLYGDDNYRLAEDIKNSTLNLLNPKNGVTDSRWFGIAMNIFDALTFIFSFPFPLVGIIAAPAKFIASTIVTLCTYADGWYVDYIKVSSPEFTDHTFYCRDWVYAENPQIVPADNVPYDVEIKTSSDSSNFNEDVYIQFVAESSEFDNEKTQNSPQLFSKSHKLIGEDFDAGSSNKYYVADKNIGDISKIKLFTKSDNEWKLESLNLVVNGKKYKCKWNNWVKGTIELVPEKNATEAAYDIEIKTFNSIDDVKDIKDAIQIQFNGEDDNSKPTSKSSTFTSESQMVEEGFEVQDLFTNNVSKLKSVTITNTKDCKLPIDYLTINNQKYYVRQVISKDQSVVIDPSDKKSAYDIKFKISDIKNFDCKGKLKSNLFVKISGKDQNYKDVEINDELPLTLSDKDINSLASGSEVKFYVASSTNIKDVEKVEIIRKNDTNAPFLPLDYVEVVSNCIDKWGSVVEMPKKCFYCGKYFRDSIVLSASDKVYKFDFKNLQDNQLQSLTAYSMSLGGKIDAGNTAANSDTVNTEPFFPALDYNSDKSQEIIIGDSCKIDKLLCLDFASESSEPNKKWGLDYVTYNGIKANVNSSFSNEESKFRIDFTNRYCVTFYIKDTYMKSHLNFSIIGENKNETKKQDFANFKDDVAAFEDENYIDKIYGIKLNSDSEIFLYSVEVNAPCGSYIFNCYRSFKDDLLLSVEDQVFDAEIKTGDVRYAASDSDISFQFKVNAGSNENDIVLSRSFEFESKSIERMQARSQRFVLLKSMNEIVENFDQILLTKGSDSDDLFLDYIKINGVIYYYRDWLSGNGQTITINTSSPKTAYNIDVKTSDIWQAGTDCDVSIILENYNGYKSDDISLDLKNVDDRGQNEINHYFIASDLDSNVDKCTVKIDDPGVWAFDYISITQIDSAGKVKDSYTFYYGRWVDRRETVLSREDKIYSISAKEMDSSIDKAAEYNNEDIYDITLIDNENKDKPKKFAKLTVPRQCQELKCASLVHDPNEEPILNVSCIHVEFLARGHALEYRQHGSLDYIKIDNKTFYCREIFKEKEIKTLYENYHPYDVCVLTGDRFCAGTNNNISIKLYGTNSQMKSASTEIMSLDSVFNDFERADFLPYNLKDKTELNTISKIEVKKDGIVDDWYLDYLTVKLPNGIIYTFDCFDWVISTVFLYPNSDKIANSPYSLTITTSDSCGAGTDNNIYAKISGFNNQNKYVSTDFHLLDLDNNNDFEIGDTDTYLIYDSVDIATIDSIELKNEYSEAFGRPDWRVASADVVHGDNRYHFDCKDEWICSDKSMTFKGPTISNDDSYCVIIRTADEVRAGTDGDIHITVHGKDGNNNDISSSVAHLLDKPGYDDFERNNCDTYLFTDSNKIDKIEKITLSNDTNCDKWCVSSLRLIHNGCDIYEFSCNNSWIGNETKPFMPSGANCPNKNIGESFRVVTKILPDEWCGSCSTIQVKITGDKGTTDFHESPGSCDFDRGGWYAFSFNDKNIGNIVKRVEFYKAGGFGWDMIGIDYMNIYYKNRWYKAKFNVKCDINKDKTISADAEVIGVVPSH